MTCVCVLVFPSSPPRILQPFSPYGNRLAGVNNTRRAVGLATFGEQRVASSTTVILDRRARCLFLTIFNDEVLESLKQQVEKITQSINRDVYDSYSLIHASDNSVVTPVTWRGKQYVRSPVVHLYPLLPPGKGNSPQV